MKKGNIYRVWFTDGFEQYIVAEFLSAVAMNLCKEILTKEAKSRGMKVDIRVFVVESHESKMNEKTH